MDLLFYKYNIFDVLENQKRQALKAVQEVPADTLLGASENDILAALVEKFRFDVPTIKEDAIHINDTREIQVDVRQSPRASKGVGGMS